jgi:hypothetical protein
MAGRFGGTLMTAVESVVRYVQDTVEVVEDAVVAATV